MAYVQQIMGDSMRKLLGGLLLAFVAACGNDGSTAPGTGTLAGVYTLRTVNSKALPTVAFPDPTTPVSVTYGIVRLRADASFIDSTAFQYRDASGQTVTEYDVYSGTYLQDGDHVTFQLPGGGSYAMAWSAGNSLVYVTDELTFVYRK